MSRADFENELRKEFIGPSMYERLNSGKYAHHDVQRWFEIWQAAESHTARECEKLVQPIVFVQDTSDDSAQHAYEEGMHEAGRTYNCAIRASYPDAFKEGE